MVEEKEIKKTPRGSKICIICHKEVTGKALKVKDDFIINSIRSIKKLFRVAQNNQLFVCDKDIAVHREKRKKFEKELLVISAIVVIIILLLNGLPLLSGRFQFSMLLSSIFIAILIIVFAILFKYAPAVEETVNPKIGLEVSRGENKNTSSLTTKKHKKREM